EGTYFLVMEFIEGRTVADELQENGPLQPDRALQIAIAVARALGVAIDARLVLRVFPYRSENRRDPQRSRNARFATCTAGLPDCGKLAGTL
ncbi:MAG: hypothetical protein IIC12_05300, partial [Proteobacteria bacterium]|nr:hypothetical protein [Pseudomonadota bacterium]